MPTLGLLLARIYTLTCFHVWSTEPSHLLVLASFDLTIAVHMAEDGDGEFAFDLNEPPLEHGNGTSLLCLTGFFFSRACLGNCAISLLLYRFSYHCFPFFLQVLI
jgi:hypothetical protein